MVNHWCGWQAQLGPCTPVSASTGHWALGTGHWALGGRWLLATVGQWAVDLSARAPLAAGAALGLVALVKLLAAVIPVAVA